MTKLSFFPALFAAMLFAPSASAQTADFNIVPRPLTVSTQANGDFTINGQTVIEFPMGNIAMKRNAEFLAQYLKETTGLQLDVRAALLPGAETKGRRPKRKIKPEANRIRLQLGLTAEAASGTVADEGYRLSSNAGGLLIEARTPAGAFYGVQTLRKALPVVKEKGAAVRVPGVVIDDAPRFAYRGAHFDTSRHYFTPDSVRRFIDLLALHNINRFHWHITDDQGWRLEIKKHPRLTEVGSKRKETVIGHNTGRYDGVPYGGFYTQKEVKDIVAYAAERHITIIPEIDMPGHMLGALAAYPELGCTGGPYEVWTMWGVSDEVLCAGNDKVLRFIEDVLDEVVALFPSEYIHVGGDECPKTRWKTCPKCQARIKAEGLQADGKHTAEERLQSFIIRHAEAHLAKLGRRMIGWDETLEGGLAPGATVMSWRGEGGGIEAAKLGHDVIMTPNTYLYFDYYQTKDRRNEPEAIGGYVPLEMVYNYEPMPKALTAEQQRHIIGVQANCWTEYMPTFKQVEYMELPRMAALSEIQWSQPQGKDYEAFLQRLRRMLNQYDLQDYNYATHVFDVTAHFAPNAAKRGIDASFSTLDNAEVRYTLDGSEPDAQSALYAGGLTVTSDATLKAAAFRDGRKSRTVSERFTFNKATACKATLKNAPAKNYTFGGAAALVDGLEGSDTNYKSGRWIGFYRNDLELVIDLGEVEKLSTLSFNTCVEKGDWVMDARYVSVETSTDGSNFKLVAEDKRAALTSADPNGIQRHELSLKGAEALYVRLTMKPEHSLPDWHPGKGNPGFLFVDEVKIK